MLNPRRKQTSDRTKMRTVWVVEKRLNGVLIEPPTVIEGNLGLNEFFNWRWGALQSAPTYYADATHTFLGVGDGSATAVATQTGLQGTNKLYKVVDVAPIVGADQKIVVHTSFGPDEANFAWNELTIGVGASASAFNTNDAAAGCINFNRKVSSLPTKSQGQTWSLTGTVTDQ